MGLEKDSLTNGNIGCAGKSLPEAEEKRGGERCQNPEAGAEVLCPAIVLERLGKGPDCRDQSAAHA